MRKHVAKLRRRLVAAKDAGQRRRLKSLARLFLHDPKVCRAHGSAKANPWRIYKPHRDVEIPKPDGGTRIIHVPHAVDLVAQRLVTEVINVAERGSGINESCGGHFNNRRKALREAIELAKVHDYATEVDFVRAYEHVDVTEIPLPYLQKKVILATIAGKKTESAEGHEPTRRVHRRTPRMGRSGLRKRSRSLPRQKKAIASHPHSLRLSLESLYGPYRSRKESVPPAHPTCVMQGASPGPIAFDVFMRKLLSLLRGDVYVRQSDNLVLFGDETGCGLETLRASIEAAQVGPITFRSRARSVRQGFDFLGCHIRRVCHLIEVRPSRKSLRKAAAKAIEKKKKGEDHLAYKRAWWRQYHGHVPAKYRPEEVRRLLAMSRSWTA